MAGIIANNDSLKDLQVRAGKLASAAESLATLLEEEANRLKRGDQVARLNALSGAIMRHMESARRDESGAGYSYSEGKAIRGIAGSVAGLIARTSNNNVLRIMSQKLLDPPANGEPPFGTILVCIGPGGVPDDVHVVSVSRWARESRREQSGVIQDLGNAQNLLLTEENFSELMDRLSEQILKGNLSLPISLQTSSRFKHLAS